MSEVASPNDNFSIARMRDGTRIAYEIHGSANARRIVLVHSLAMDRAFWRPVARELAGNAAALAYDCRGHGRSDKPAGPYTVELFADDLADLLDAVGWDAACVAGASMGGCVSLAFAAAYPERVQGLGLIDTTDYYGPDAPKAWADRAAKALNEGMGALVEFQKTRWFGDRFREENPDILNAALEVFLANDVRAYAETCRMLGACDMREALPGPDMPVRIVVGEEDYATPVATARSMHERIEGSSLCVIDGARHFTPLEVPQTIAGELAELLKDVQ